MKENKNIDKFFQEKMNALDFEPNEIVWKNIKEQLKEKKKKRVIPFWWKLSGIAASLVLGIGIYTNKLSNNPTGNSVVISNESKNQIEKNNSKTTNSSENAVVENENIGRNSKTTTNSSENTVVENGSDSNKIDSSVNNYNTSETNSTTKKTGSKEIQKKINSRNNSSIATISSKRNYEIKTKKAVVSDKNNDLIVQKSNDKKEKVSYDLNAIITENKVSQSKIETEKIGAITSENKSQSVKNIETSTSKSLAKVEPKVDVFKKIDSASIASVASNAMEELLHEKEKKTIKKEQKLNRWQLSSNVAPIYFSSTKNGSPLDSKFKNNTKDFNTNIGYGVGVKYAVNKKIKIRTGVNSLVADYNTNNIVAYQSANASRMEHVDSNLRGSLIQIENKNPQEMQTLEGDGIILKKYDGVLNQKIGYIEVPLEMSYKILDRKFGVEVIGGVSSLFLNQNEVSVETSGTQMIIGKADNLNAVHFSGNVGLGLKYSFLKNIDLHLEPLFKYQFNTFNDTSGNFKPYVFGIYSGLSYSF